MLSDFRGGDNVHPREAVKYPATADNLTGEPDRNCKIVNQPVKKQKSCSTQ